jgi:hypothetical protein
MRHILWFICYCFAFSAAQAQTQARFALTIPLEGAVYQQYENGLGLFKVNGTYNSQAFRNGTKTAIATLTPLSLVTGQPNGGANIEFALTRTGTTFSATRTVQAGWYSLKITMRDVSSSVPDIVSGSIKAGVGEVFIISGQSAFRSMLRQVAPYLPA